MDPLAWPGHLVVAGRFMPFLRPFVPFVAGALRVGSLITLGWAFGNVPPVKANLSLIVWTMIGIPGVVVLVGLLRARRRTQPAVP